MVPLPPYSSLDLGHAPPLSAFLPAQPHRHGQGQVNGSWGHVRGGGLESLKEHPQGQASLSPEKQK